jgi:hypothetical protein
VAGARASYEQEPPEWGETEDEDLPPRAPAPPVDQAAATQQPQTQAEPQAASAASPLKRAADAAPGELALKAKKAKKQPDAAAEQAQPVSQQAQTQAPQLRPEPLPVPPPPRPATVAPSLLRRLLGLAGIDLTQPVRHKRKHPSA